jgi:hypothetical protein
MLQWIVKNINLTKTLWECHTLIKTTTCFTPFHFIYGIEIIILINIESKVEGHTLILFF